jgi:hypothetical protein
MSSSSLLVEKWFFCDHVELLEYSFILAAAVLFHSSGKSSALSKAVRTQLGNPRESDYIVLSTTRNPLIALEAIV